MASRNARGGTAGGPHGTCPSITVLEEYAAARLHGGDTHPSITEHVAACSRCAARVDRLAADTETLRNSLMAVDSEPGAPCPSPETLAAYIDQAVEPRDRQRIEQHAAACRPCQEKLKNICRETTGSVSEDAEPYGVTPPVILTDKKRTKRRTPKKKQEDGLGDSADEEQRKKRLSSDRS